MQYYVGSPPTTAKRRYNIAELKAETQRMVEQDLLSAIDRSNSDPWAIPQKILPEGLAEAAHGIIETHLRNAPKTAKKLGYGSAALSAASAGTIALMIIYLPVTVLSSAAVLTLGAVWFAALGASFTCFENTKIANQYQQKDEASPVVLNPEARGNWLLFQIAKRSLLALPKQALTIEAYAEKYDKSMPYRATDAARVARTHLNSADRGLHKTH